MIYSFDIFDTLITRKTADPLGVFSYMKQQLLIMKDGSYPLELINSFDIIRVDAERYAREYLKKLELRPQDITLKHIYDRIAFTFDITDNQKEYLMNLEVQSEIDLIYPLKENIAKLKNLIKNNEKVILISDMYLLSEDIRKLLVSVDDIFTNIKIYASSETKRLKATGDMYDFVKEKEHLDFSKWTHYGDNLHSDYNMSRFKGINAIHLPVKDKFEFEKRYLYPSYKGSTDNITSQFVVGLSDIMRLKTTNERELLGVTYFCPIGL